MSGVLAMLRLPYLRDIAPISRSYSSSSAVTVTFNFFSGSNGTYGLLSTAANGNGRAYGPIRNVAYPLPSLHVRLRQISFSGTAGIALNDFTLNTWVPQFYPSAGTHTVQLFTTSVGSSTVVYEMDISLDGGASVAKTYSVTLTATRT